jgi:hypothetical protein
LLILSYFKIFSTYLNRFIFDGSTWTLWLYILCTSYIFTKAFLHFMWVFLLFVMIWHIKSVNSFSSYNTRVFNHLIFSNSRFGFFRKCNQIKLIKHFIFHHLAFSYFHVQTFMPLNSLRHVLIWLVLCVGEYCLKSLFDCAISFVADFNRWRKRVKNSYSFSQKIKLKFSTSY